jgi:hypothetical protein
MTDDLIEKMTTLIITDTDIESAIRTLLLCGFSPLVIDAHFDLAFERARKFRTTWNKPIDRRISIV